ncbi:DUF4136 domain-containing protein [Lysobacter sp. SG-8]|uniref:DUF4136 domain-containing protein n=1 Tax=Marilutibacter penaei TaxID=2759900 RepID=A0A7W3U125_9GAMM|nr:DUF4136 domain-containing protein [Lysobacter penaei]MBB1086993.1 DUF4136 domain-containing protein [Lysobacter penaei]
MSVSVPSRVPSRRLRCAALALLLPIALAACYSVPAPEGPRAHVTVRVPAATLPGATYAWVDMPAQLQAEQDVRVQDPAFRAHLQAAFDEALAAKGYAPAGDPATADFIVAFRVGVRDVQEVSSVSGVRGEVDEREAGFECSGGSCSQLVTRSDDGLPVFKMKTAAAVEGGLLVEALEPRSVRVLWSAYNRGTIERDLSRDAGLEAVARDTLAALPAR